MTNTASKRRLTTYYVVLLAVVVAVFALVFSAGSDEHAEPSIAGGYDVAAGGTCLGKAFDLLQSGRYVNLRAGQESRPKGKLEWKNGVLTGPVTCVAGGERQLRATVRDGTLRGAVTGIPVAAAFKRDPPPPGAPTLVPTSVASDYNVIPRSACLGGRIELKQSGRTVTLEPAKKGEPSTLAYAAGKLTGPVRCVDGTIQAGSGTAVDRRITLTLTPAGKGGFPSTVVLDRRRDFTAGLAIFFLAIVIVMLAARWAGTLMTRIRQPRVMGEVLAGIVLGPTLFGLILPNLQASLFPSDVIPWLGVAANLGLIFYMFLIGLEIDLSQLRGRIGQTAAISNTGVLVPMAAGVAVALPVYELIAPPTKFVAFALFMGVAMSITAFPVLARILVERRMLKRPLGALALASAAIDDVSAWFLIAIATAVATAGTAAGVATTILLAIAFCLAMALLVRPVLARASVAFDEAGRVPGGWIAAIFAGVLLSAFVTEEIGIALIFGAFVMGAAMPRHAGLTEDVTRRLEDFVAVLLLPLFFAYTGLKTNVGLIDRWSLVVLTLVLIVVAVACKFGGTFVASRVTGLGWRESAVVGALMNTRGLTELIVLNLALEKGVLSQSLFTMLVLMALVTTFMTGPGLNRLDPRQEYGAPVGEELEEARGQGDDLALPTPDRSILVAPNSDAALVQLRALAEPLARSVPPRELIIVSPVVVTRGVSVRGGLQSQNRLLADANASAGQAARELRERGIASRGVAILSEEVGNDLVRLTEDEGIDLLLIDGRRPLLGDGVPRGDVGQLLRNAPCDVGVLVARDDDEVVLGPDAPVVVPFGGAEHDWAALELGAWIAAAADAPLRLLGVGGDGRADGEDDAGNPTRMLANAALVVQQLVGVQTEPLVAEPGREGILKAAADAGVLIIGLSERWRDEGLGPTRSEIARAAPAPVLFVRRGTRTGALAPREDMTRFTWSAPGAGPPLAPSLS